MSDRPLVHDDLTAHRAWTQDAVAALVGECISMMKSGNIARLKLKHGDLRLSLRAHESTPVGTPVVTGSVATTLHEPVLVDERVDGAAHVIAAPMIGTYYSASAPGEPPFVRVGDRVDEGQTVAIIEAMKIMNEIAADRAGTVKEILVTNGQTVEYGTALITLSIAD